MGRIVAPYGVRGWVKIQPDTEQVDGLLAYRQWWLGRDGSRQQRKVIEGRTHGSLLVARLAGCEDRDQALALRGMEISVPRTELPPPEAGEFYWCDLIGLDVENMSGVPFGQVEEVIATGANDVLVVRGERERLIPFIDSVVIEVDIGAARIRVDWGADY